MSTTSRILWLLLIIVLAVILDFITLRIIRQYRELLEHHKDEGSKVSRGLLCKEAIMKSLNKNSPIKFQKLIHHNMQLRKPLQITLELTIIGLWAIFVGHEYLNFNPQFVPMGREFLSSIQTHHMWTRFQDCGWCSLWNNTTRGGYPMFVDVHGSMLHPVVILSTLCWGVINGTKVALVFAMWCAGVAQWCMARMLKLGGLPRLWSAGMAIVGGHLTGRMELGVFGALFSTAMCCLVFCGIIYISRGGGRRAIVVFAILLASALVSGHGYMQVGLAGAFPAIILLVIEGDRDKRSIWKDYCIAILIAILLAMPFLISFLHFSPNFIKDVDHEFKSVQPLVFIPLNLVINDWHFYHSEVLGKLPFPQINNLFIGWIPIILAIIGLSISPKKYKSYILFFTCVIIIEFLIGSAILLRWIEKVYPGIAGVRFPSQISGLAVPMILAISAIGLDSLINKTWPILGLEVTESPIDIKWKVTLQWLLIIPLFFSLKVGYEFSKNWIDTISLDDEIFKIVQNLDTNSLQWVNTPFGEHQFIEYAVRKDLKLSPGIMTWYWEGRDVPKPVLEANRIGPSSDNSINFGSVGDITIYQYYDNHYAAVISDGVVEPCTAQGSGGNITVVCNSSTPGKLVVLENSWTGWKAWMDGERVPLIGTNWLEVDSPDGKHVFQFRYRPWDVPLGLALSLVGLLVCVYLWFSGSRRVNSKGLKYKGITKT
jgi:hypothetical protein